MLYYTFRVLTDTQYIILVKIFIISIYFWIFRLLLKMYTFIFIYIYIYTLWNSYAIRCGIKN